MFEYGMQVKDFYVIFNINSTVEKMRTNDEVIWRVKLVGII